MLKWDRLEQVLILQGQKTDMVAFKNLDVK